MNDTVVAPAYVFEGFRLDAQHRVLTRANGEAIPLAPKVFDTLLYFAERPGQLIGKRELLDAIWPNVVVEENNLSQAISTLRRALGEATGDHRFIVTEPGRGYRFVARVERHEELARTLFAVSRTTWTRLSRAAAVAMLALVAGITGWLLAPGLDPTISRWLELYPVGPPVAARLSAAPEGNRFIAASADGARLAYDLDESIWLQTLGRQDATPIATGRSPFFSPDGEWVAFVSQDSLMKLSVHDRVPLPIVPFLPEGRYLGGSWHDETIVFATQNGVYRIAANDESEKAELILRAPDSATYAWPQIMLDGRYVLLTVISGASIEAASIALLDLEDRRLTSTLVRGAVGARYVSSSDASSGYLIYAAGERGSLTAREFDPRTRTIGPVPTAIEDVEVLVFGTYFAAVFDVTSSGSLLYVGPRARRREQLAWVDHHGLEEAIDAALPQNGRLAYPRVSPDGNQVAFDADGGTGRRRIWTMDLSRGVPVQLTERGDHKPVYEDVQALWSRDGSRIHFGSTRTGGFRIWSRAADGSGDDELLSENADLSIPVATTPNDQILAIRGSSANDADILLLDPRNAEHVAPLIESPSGEWTPALSPDGRWMAYVSSELGDRYEVFVQSFPAGDIKRRVSRHGGTNPLWGLNGSNELYYVGYTESGEVAMFTANVSTADGLNVVGERELFRKPYLRDMGQPRGLRRYDISPRDGRFIFFVPVDPDEERQADEVMTIWHMRNWVEAL